MTDIIQACPGASSAIVARTSRRREWASAFAVAVVPMVAYAALAPASLSASLCRWDCGWYLGVAAHGYDSTTHLVGIYHQANWAFFPLYPMLVWATGLLVAPPQLAGCLVSAVCCIVFAWLGARYRAHTRPAASGGWMLLLATWPFSLYLHVQYSEGLYDALATGMLLALAERRVFVAGSTAAFLTASRPTGILLAVWLGARQMAAARRAATPAEAIRLLLPAAIGVLGLVAFMTYLALRLGDPFAFAAIQGAWRHHLSNPLGVLADGFADMSLARHHIGRAYESAWAVLGLVASIWLIIRSRFAEGFLCGMTVLMALLSGVVDSMPRFVATNPAFLFAVADGFDRVTWKPARLVILCALAGLQLVVVRAWYANATYLS